MWFLPSSLGESSSRFGVSRGSGIGHDGETESPGLLSTPVLVVDLTRLGVGAIATFLAILLWSNTRDTAWMFIVMGTILRYAEIMYTTFRLLGIAPSVSGSIIGLPVMTIIQLLLQNLPIALYAVGFIIMLVRSRIR